MRGTTCWIPSLAFSSGEILEPCSSTNLRDCALSAPSTQARKHRRAEPLKCQVQCNLNDPRRIPWDQACDFAKGLAPVGRTGIGKVRMVYHVQRFRRSEEHT